MGLDMYLEAEASVYTSSEEEKELNTKIRNALEDAGLKGIKDYRTDNLNYVSVSFEVGYWRKANQIHRWFVENVQGGNDDCGRYWVSREKLEKLRDLCKEVLEKVEVMEGTVTNGYIIDKEGTKPIVEVGKVIKNPDIAKELLPTQGGFFFGSTEYNEWYIEDLKRTVEIIDKALKLPKKWDFYYHSSW